MGGDWSGRGGRAVRAGRWGGRGGGAGGAEVLGVPWVVSGQKGAIGGDSGVLY